MSQDLRLKTNNLTIIILSALLIGGIFGGLITFSLTPDQGQDFDLPPKDVFTMGFIPENAEDVDTVTTNAQALTAFLQDKLGIPVEIYPVSNGYENLILALQNNQVDAAFLDGTPASLVVESGNAEVVMAEIRSANNATFYNAAAWVRANSTIDSLSTMLNGNYISSHTSATGTAGTVMPLGTLIDEGFIETQANDDTESVCARYFSNSIFGGSYGGALLRVLDGEADVAFVRDTTPMDLFPERQDELRMLHVFGSVPSHPLVVNTDLADGWKYKFVNAMLELNNPENIEILKNLYGANGLVGANNLHIQDVSDAVKSLPWLEETILADRG